MNAIEFENVGKQYRLGLVSTGTFSHDLNRWWTMNVRRKEDPYLKIGETNDRSHKGNSEYVWALKDINFKIEQGDVVGIIGKNGAGKSTLLKLLSRVTTPTTGRITAYGRIASLLEVGTGFHPEMTGRENIYLNGAIMGMTKAEVSRKLDEIVDFSGCERYIDTPVKRYSSGMTVRLGFAIAAHLEPEILVVDEVLAVGDAEFQKKAIGKMQDVSSNSGRTVLFVSHNMSSIKALCNKGIVLRNGQVEFIGTAESSIDNYLHTQESFTGLIKDHITKIKPCITIETIEFNDTNSTNTTIKSGQETLVVRVVGSTTEELNVDLMVIIRNREGVPMATLAEGHCKGKTEKVLPGSFKIEKKILLPKILNTGDYYVDILLHNPTVEGLVDCYRSVNLHIDGYQEGVGRALISNKEGFMGFESI